MVQGKEIELGARVFLLNTTRETVHPIEHGLLLELVDGVGSADPTEVVQQVNPHPLSLAVNRVAKVLE